MSHRHARQARFAPIGDAGQRQLASSRVLLVGVGALGSHLAASLVRAGVGQLWLVDRDVVELSNLQRQQLFTEDDAARGRPKAHAAAERLAKIDSRCQLVPIADEFRAASWSELGQMPDLILDGTDNFATRYLLNDLAIAHRVPWIYGGAVGAVGTAMAVLPGDTPCLRCWLPAAPPAGEVGTCETEGILAPTIAAVAAFQAAQALKILTGHRDRVARGVWTADVWNDRYGLRLRDAARDPQCPACGSGDLPALAADLPPARLCGRNAVQVRPAARRDVDLTGSRCGSAASPPRSTARRSCSGSRSRAAASACSQEGAPCCSASTTPTAGGCCTIATSEPRDPRHRGRETMIYLDHASTSFPKPPGVIEAIQRWYLELGVSADRGDSEPCAQVAQVVEATRRRLGGLCGCPADRVAFTSGATESLNLFLRGFLRGGDRVLTTALEHSSVVRPLVALRAERALELDVLAPAADGQLNPAAVEDALRKQPRLFVFSHASNVLGSVLDATSLCALARRHGTTTLLDASQTAGVLALDVGADAVAGSAHKGLLGPPGLGFLAVRDGLPIETTKTGGSGSSTALDTHPTAWPHAMQAGTPNTPAIFGLAAALAWLEQEGHRAHQNSLAHLAAIERVLRDRGAQTFGPPAETRPRLPIASFRIDGFDNAEIGALLAEAHVHVRTGFHCAPWLHEVLGTADGGTVRVSTGWSTTADDVAAFASALPP